MDRASQAEGTGCVTPVDDALTGLVAGLDALIATVEAGGLNHFDDAQLVGFMQAFERVRNRMPLVDHPVVMEAQARRLAERMPQPGLSRVLVETLRISSAEAYRRVHAAGAVGLRRSVTGERLEPRRPVLAAAQRVGDVTPEQVHIIQRALGSVDRPGFDPADIAVGEALLTDQARTFEPAVLSQLAEQVVAAIDPDGTLPKDRLNADRRHFAVRSTKDGAYVGEFRLTGVLGAKLLAVLGPLARPRIDRIPGPNQATTDTDRADTEGADTEGADTDDAAADGAAAGAEGAAADSSGAAGAVRVDERTHGQRMHDALEEVCDRLLRAGGLPDSGGTPATVIVTITLEALLSRLGYGRTSDGKLLSAAQVLELAAQAEIIPTVINQSGAVLSQGRARRIATPAQTCALIARDVGCSFPGCNRPPELCERHHVIAWIDGGDTDLNNLTLLCRFHHHQFAGYGWTVAINPDGLPEWTPPAWIDRQRRPLINARILLDRHVRQHATDHARRSTVTTAA